MCPVKRTKELLDETPLTGWLNVATTAPLTVDGVLIATEVGPVIEKHPVQTLWPPLSEFVNVTSRAPSAAPPAMSIVARRLVLLRNTSGGLSVMPEPENAMLVPCVKPAPTMSMT